MPDITPDRTIFTEAPEAALWAHAHLTDAIRILESISADDTALRVGAIASEIERAVADRHNLVDVRSRMQGEGCAR